MFPYDAVFPPRGSVVGQIDNHGFADLIAYDQFKQDVRHHFIDSQKGFQLPPACDVHIGHSLCRQ